MPGLREISHLLISLAVLTFAFSYPNLIPEVFAIVAVGVGTGFLLHELAHKFTAQKYGYSAEYEASPIGLLLAVGLSLMTKGGFVFAAPGAVMIWSKKIIYSPTDEKYWESMASPKEESYISIAGVVVNLTLAVIFTIALFFVDVQSQYLLSLILYQGAKINVFLAGFNMIPFGPLDGAKVLRYNPVLWAAIGLPSIILFFILQF